MSLLPTLIDGVNAGRELITNDTTGDRIVTVIVSGDAAKFRRAGLADIIASHNADKTRLGLKTDTAVDSWVEWANMTFNDKAPTTQQNGLGKFKTEWDIPAEPATPVDNAQISAWMGIQPSPDVTTGTSVFQNVLIYNWKNDNDGHTFSKNWSAAVWHATNNGGTYTISDRLGPLSSGNTIKGTSEYKPLSSKWYAYLEAGGKSKYLYSTDTVGKLDQKKVQAFVVLESYTAKHVPTLNATGYDEQYFFKNVKFKIFAL